MSFDYEYTTEVCELHDVVEGPSAKLRTSGSYRNFEHLSAGSTAWLGYKDLLLRHASVYYINVHVTNNMGED